MRLMILGWSTFSGVLLGLFAGVALGAVCWFASGLLPARWTTQGTGARLRVALLVLCLVVPPLAGAVLGYLEGRLKLT